jgi:hypothetical protein
VAMTASKQIEVILQEGGSERLHVTSSAAMTDPGFHHVAVSQDGSNAKVFLDGSESSTTGTNAGSWTSQLASADVSIGKGQAGGYAGVVDEMSIWSRPLSAEEVKRTVEESNLRALWHFDEGSGAIASDSSGSGNNATLSGMDPSACWVQGKSATALHFDGGSGKLVVADNAGLHLTDAMSVELWVKFDSLDENEILLDNRLFQVFHRGGWAGNRLYFMLETTATSSLGDSAWDSWAGVKTQNELGAGEWYHLVGVRSGSSLSVFLNGEFERETSCLSGATIDPSRIRDLQMGLSGFKGTLDEVALYPRALSADEIRWRYRKAGKP